MRCPAAAPALHDDMSAQRGGIAITAGERIDHRRMLLERFVHAAFHAHLQTPITTQQLD
jgi:hypothetical protein